MINELIQCPIVLLKSNGIFTLFDDEKSAVSAAKNLKEGTYFIYDARNNTQLQAENKRLREAIEEILTHGDFYCIGCKYIHEIAQKALEKKDD